MTIARHVLAIDQGTTSSRAMLFDHDGTQVSVAQVEHRQIFPRAGWVEHDPVEIWDAVRQVVARVVADADIMGDDIAAVGITNQRETTVVWDRHTGLPVHNAIVWQDTRTADICHDLAAASPEGVDRWRRTTGLPVSTYFSGPKVRWILDEVPGARERAEAGDLLFGTIDTWLLWNLTGGARGDAGRPAVHATDVTNASRTMLMDLETLAWDADIVAAMGIPASMLPEIRPSSGDFGAIREHAALAGIPITGILGDQQAAAFGQTCFAPGEAKNTYGTGNFLLLNTGTTPRFSTNGLLTTVCYRIDGDAPVYALEGSIAVTGSLVQWLRDNLGMISSAAEIETAAREVDDNGGCYIVPAFSGLLAPHWRDDARGVIVGLTRFVDRRHICRAALESAAYQTLEVVEAMDADSGVPLTTLKVDGGMTANELLLGFQADILGVPVVRPRVTETTALGAAYAAGLAVGFWASTDDLREHWREDRRWEPGMDAARRDSLVRGWRKAVTRTLDWVG